MVAGRKSRVASWEPAGCADLLIRIFCFCLQRSGLCGADLQIGMICVKIEESLSHLEMVSPEQAD